MDKTIYKNISISKLQDTAEVNSKLPTHTLNISDEKFQNKNKAGSLWTKEGQYGKFLSGTLQNAGSYKDKEGNNKERTGYSIISDEYLNFLLNKQSIEVEPKGLDNDEIDF